MVELLRFITGSQQAVGLVWAVLSSGTAKTTLSLLLEEPWPVRLGLPLSHLPPDGTADMELNRHFQLPGLSSTAPGTFFQ